MNEAINIKVIDCDELTPGQRIALEHSLSEIPQNKSFNEILDLIENESDDIVIWEPFQNFDQGRLIEHIESLAESIDTAMERGVK